MDRPKLKSEGGLFSDGLGPPFTLHSDGYRFRLLLFVVACELLTLIITWSLWGTREAPVNLPLVSLHLPFKVLMVGSLVFLVARPRLGAIVHAVVFLLACVDDQYRVQPQFICFVVLIFALVFEQGLWFARWYLVALWGWTGVHKLLSPEWLGAGAWTFLYRCGVDSGEYSVLFAVGIAVVEIGLAIAAVVNPRRAAVGCVMLHVGVLFVLSPLVRNHNPSVWPWNFVMAVVG